MTRYGAAGTDTRRVLVPSCPTGWGGTAPSPSLALLDVARCYAFVVPPRIWELWRSRGTRAKHGSGPPDFYHGLLAPQSSRSYFEIFR